MLRVASESTTAKLTKFARAHGLSARQLEVLALVCDGLRNREIAARLGLALITVEQHVSGLLRTTAVRGRTQLVARAFGRG